MSRPGYHKDYYEANKEALKSKAVEHWALIKDTELVRRKRLLKSARDRAKSRGVEFTITLEDIEIPRLCPYLGIKLLTVTVPHHGHSPSLDRIDNTLGYVPGNVQVISRRANTMKSDASLGELLRFAASVVRLHGNEE